MSKLDYFSPIPVFLPIAYVGLLACSRWEMVKCSVFIPNHSDQVIPMLYPNGYTLVTLCRPCLVYILISDIRALWRSGLSARVPECQKLKM